MTLFIHSLLTGDYADLRIKLAIIAIMWLFVAVAIVIDLISGYRKAKERNEARTSYGLRRTVTKIVMYYAMMLFAFMFDCIGMFFYPQPYVTFIAAGFLIFIEAKSILEKANDKDKKKLNKSLQDLSAILDNRDDLIKGIAETLKNQLTDKKETEDETNR
ncbi:phage-related holin [Dysgonomonas sp. PFB1-18]|uniref:phage holin family protein n=1 Tax=unclassified Dysgonomonas TaxID=2630389 RepID=UPI002473B9AE|nr:MULTISPECIES: phage holin family protein [unclassified Dysgonomonas]MDH6309285.1 phage-related holin [Dysgonomonas sp. PF1-14]MDH6339850.1 phage-related holin [Dysgonomonas sp. PF1-16]MDH6381498.1 phage-related holin [Dysgonomonas sp. PFB1-18]MDH6398713.1 phage-related holin [Dysgonomonas sp. PF1-23]